MGPRKCDECKNNLIAAKVVIDGKTSYLCRSCTEDVQRDNPDQSLCERCRANPTVVTFEKEHSPLSVCAECSAGVEQELGGGSKAKEAADGGSEPKFGISAKQGKRPTMEDADQAIARLDQLFDVGGGRTASYFAVFDGHGGQRVAEFCKHQVHKSIVESDAFKAGDVQQALIDGFKSADDEVLQMCKDGDWSDGATGVVALVLGDRLWVANVGDSEVVLGVRQGSATLTDDTDPAFVDQEAQGTDLIARCVTKKHKPDDPDEKKRITAAGGVVLFGRTGGQMAISRSFGDVNFKKLGNDSDDDHISIVPHVASCAVEGIEFMIVACDGLYDMFEYGDSISFAKEEFKRGKSCAEVAEALVDESLERGSSDNVSVIVVQF